MAKTSEEKLRRDVRVLRKKCPLLLPVRVYLRELENVLGYTSLRYDENQRPSHFVIQIEKRMTWDAMWQVLIHEWAHALSWSEGDTHLDHGAAWGVALSRIYQLTVEP